MQLIVAEKPSVARDLARVLGVPASGSSSFEGEGRVITWCRGHLVELEEPVAYDARWKAWRLDTLPMLPEVFRLRPSREGAGQYRVVAGLLRSRRFGEVVNACDAGREGELIFRYLYQHAGCRLPVRRLWISSLTDEAVRAGWQALRSGAALDPLADAARCRSEADWLVGLNATRALTIKRRAGGDSPLLSIGRVQTPTLAMLVARERQIREFVPRDYFEVVGSFAPPEGGSRFEALFGHAGRSRLAARGVADAIAERDRGWERAGGEAAPVVERVRARTVKEPPPLLFDLTSLQRTANRRFGFSAARTLEIAQALYERHKLLTYPRTDSRHLTADVARTLPALLEALARITDYQPLVRPLLPTPPRLGRRFVDDGKVSDHHAIIPTGKAARLEGLPVDERRIFDLVVRRLIGAFYPDAEFAVTDVIVRVGGGGAASTDEQPPLPPDGIEAPRGSRPVSAATAAGNDKADDKMIEALPPAPDRYACRGRVRRVAGWQEVAGIAGGEERAGRRDRPGRADDGDGPSGDDRGDPPPPLPPLTEGQRLTGEFAPRARRTTPPQRHTEATLLAAMESAGRTIDDEALRAAMRDVGLGTPATRAAIIETLIDRGFIGRERKSLVPTPTGMALIEALPVPSLASPELTGAWEARLARVARGEERRDAFMADIRAYVRDVVATIVASEAPPLRREPRLADPPPGFGDPASDSDGRLVARDRSASDDQRRLRQPGGAKGGPWRGSRGGGARTGRAGHAAGAPGPRSDRRPRGGSREPTRGSPRRATSVQLASASDEAAKPGQQLPGAISCPRCRQGQLLTGKRGWGCSRWREGCGFVVWFETAGKRLTLRMLEDLVTRGKTRRSSFRPDGNAPIEGRLVLDADAPGGARFLPA